MVLPLTLQPLITDDKLVDFAVLSVRHIQGVTALVQHQAVGDVHFAPGQAVLHLKLATCTVPNHPGVAVPICHKDGAVICHCNLQQECRSTSPRQHAVGAAVS